MKKGKNFTKNISKNMPGIQKTATWEPTSNVNPMLVIKKRSTGEAKIGVNPNKQQKFEVDFMLIVSLYESKS